MRAGKFAAILVFLTLAAAKSDAAPSPQDLERVVEAEKDFNGQVYVEEDGAVLVDAAIGHADSAGKLPVDRATLFNIASATKALTAIAVLQQIEAHRLSLDTTIATLFSDVPADKASITIGQLLTHTSGLPHGYESNGKTALRDAVAAILAQPLAGKPGAFQYTDEGYELLAAAVQKVSGKDYCTYLHNAIFKPANMGARCWEEVPANGTPGAADILQNLPQSNLRGLNWGIGVRVEPGQARTISRACLPRWRRTSCSASNRSMPCGRRACP